MTEQDMMLMGRRVYISETVVDKARMQVSPEFERLQSPRLVLDTNKWMRGFFGVTPVVHVARLPRFGLLDPFAYDEVILVSPAGFDALQAVAARDARYSIDTTLLRSQVIKKARV